MKNVQLPKRRFKRNSVDLTTAALLTAAALILSWIETFIPMPFPGAKAGFANLAVLMALFLLGNRQAILIDVLRVLLAGFLFGSFGSILYSMSGAVLSLIAMIGVKSMTKNMILLTSIAGGIFHNIGQIICACLMVKTVSLLFAWGPVLLVMGILTGGLNGFLASLLLPKLSFLRRN